MHRVDITADLNDEDQTGYLWTFLSNSGAPSSASSSLMRRPVAGRDRCRAADPRAKPPLRAIARNAST
jgi:hypothetical protein